VPFRAEDQLRRQRGQPCPQVHRTAHMIAAQACLFLMLQRDRLDRISVVAVVTIRSER